MTDAAPNTTGTTAKTDASVTDPAGRGRLKVADLVVERIAMIAASQVPGVVPAGTSLDGVVGRRYPKASADVAGDRATIDVQIAVVWTPGLAATATAVRDRVRTHVRDMAGLSVDAVNVTIAQVVQQPPTQPPRRVQ